MEIAEENSNWSRLIDKILQDQAEHFHFIRLKIWNTEEELIPSTMEKSVAMARAMITSLALTWFRQDSRTILTCARKSSQLVMLTTLYGIIQILFKDKWEALHFLFPFEGGLRLVFVPLFNVFFYLCFFRGSLRRNNSVSQIFWHCFIKASPVIRKFLFNLMF